MGMMKLDMICLVAGTSLMLVLVLASAFIGSQRHGAPQHARPAHPNSGDQS
jgi:hypothetical protein